MIIKWVHAEEKLKDLANLKLTFKDKEAKNAPLPTKISSNMSLVPT